ncbi:DUF2939 domain-containing protein [soil metagenome]
MNRKLVTGLVLVLAIAGLALFAASPMFAVRNLIAAAKAGDEAQLNRQVDFPAFRTSLKEALNARLVDQMRADLGDRGGALGGLGMLLAPSLIGGAVDAFVTPQAVAAMVREGEAPGARDLARGRVTPADNAPNTRVRQSYSYRDVNTFAVRLTRDDQPDDHIDLLMERRGPFTWKLAGVDLPRKER